jgi:hypothetical protein
MLTSVAITFDAAWRAERAPTRCGSFSDAGDVFICAECQADAKQFIEIQDRIWAEIAETGESNDGTDKPGDL